MDAWNRTEEERKNDSFTPLNQYHLLYRRIVLECLTPLDIMLPRARLGGIDEDRWDKDEDEDETDSSEGDITTSSLPLINPHDFVPVGSPIFPSAVWQRHSSGSQGAVVRNPNLSMLLYISRLVNLSDSTVPPRLTESCWMPSTTYRGIDAFLPNSYYI